MNFEILVDDLLDTVAPNCTLAPTANKHVLTLVNDYENRLWRYQRFQNFVWDNIALTALSSRERQALAGRSQTELVKAAANLRLTDTSKDPGKGSELAEVVLYAVMCHHYGALPVVPKIYYKQNSQDFAKGADSVHIVLDAADGFTLWLGEAKFYSSLEDARLSTIVGSVSNLFDRDKLRKEASVLTSLADLDHLVEDAALRDRIRNALSGDTSLDAIKPKLHIPVLLLHQCSVTEQATEVTDAYRAAIRAAHADRAVAYFSKQIAALGSMHLYEKVTFHIILFPVPDKDKIVSRFVSMTKLYTEK